MLVIIVKTLWHGLPCPPCPVPPGHSEAGATSSGLFRIEEQTVSGDRKEGA